MLGPCLVAAHQGGAVLDSSCSSGKDRNFGLVLGWSGPTKDDAEDHRHCQKWDQFVFYGCSF